MAHEDKNLSAYQNVFFVGIAGAGMSALAQYLQGTGVQVSGSDRFFNQNPNSLVEKQLQAQGIVCYPQGDSQLGTTCDLVVVSTAIEDSVPEVQAAKERSIPLMRRSELLALICSSKKTIAIAGTSGKSSTAGMLFQILSDGGLDPSVITGAGLTSLIENGLIGNAHVGKSEWLIIEADESDGSIVGYRPYISVLLNIDKDHQEIDELQTLFSVFKANTSYRFITNHANALSAAFSVDPKFDFAFEDSSVGYNAEHFRQEGFIIQFQMRGENFRLKTVGRHNVENASAAIAVAHQIGMPLSAIASSLYNYRGIYRRHQIIGEKEGMVIIDDYAHNPAKCAASLRACQPLGKKLVGWFQPHGYGPTRFLKDDFIHEIAHALRPEDEIWMSEIFYAGGTVVKDISAKDLVEGIKRLGKKAFFVEDRQELLEAMRPSLENADVLLLMGARDPSLEEFGKHVVKSVL